MNTLAIAFFTWLGLIGGTWTLFSRAEDVASSLLKTKVTDWLKYGVRTQSSDRWSKTFTGVFDAVFGAQRLSMSFFLRSSIASMCWLLILFGMGISFYEKAFALNLPFEENKIGVFIIAPIVLVVINALPDYLSLVKARIILDYMSRNVSWLRNGVLLIIDALGSLVVWIGCTWIFIKVGKFIVFGSMDLVLKYEILQQLLFSFEDPYYYFARISPYATVLTSIWVWLYFLSGSVIRILNSIKHGGASLIPLLDVEKKPLQSIGAIAVCLESMVFWLVFLASL